MNEVKLIIGLSTLILAFLCAIYATYMYEIDSFFYFLVKDWKAKRLDKKVNKNLK